MSRFYTNHDIQGILGVGRTTAYEIIRTLNAELRNKGYHTIDGRVSKKYFCERYNCDE